ncbi:MAG: zinc-binding dehydrogenase, partial [Planctomycetota bacterium]
MQNKAVTFTEVDKVEILESEIDEKVADNEVLLKTCYSMISPGTELTCLNGMNSWWFDFPGVPGYSNVAEVVDIGSKVEGLSKGDKVLNYAPHQLYNKQEDGQVMLKVCNNYPLDMVPLTRLATVAFTAVRVSEIELGDYVAVAGMGVVGNIAAQLAACQGGQVIAIDINDKRLELAKECGITTTINAAKEDVEETVMKLTNGKKVNTLIDATGSSKAIEANMNLIGRLGELI